jgi:hypothetical protein
VQETGHPDLVIKLAKPIQLLESSGHALGSADVALRDGTNPATANIALGGCISEGYTYLTSASDLLKRMQQRFRACGVNAQSFASLSNN